MGGGAGSRYSGLDLVFSVVGLCTFLLDWGSDLWVAAEFYRRGEWGWFGLLLGLMALSSAVVQMFSWYWFRYDRDLPGPEQPADPAGPQAGLCGDRVWLSCLLHVLQLGFLCRHLRAIRQGFRVWWRREEGSEYAVYLTHDLSMLRLIETFCESAPQLILMVYVMLRTNKARTFQFVSMAASTTSIAWMVVDYHRSLRSFLPDKAQQGWGSSLVYFLWNLLLIGPRLAALALFSSVLPGFIAAHFLLLWPALVLWAWRQRTEFMDSAGGEWLYRATVGLIWYFSWFNVAEGCTRGRSLIYHSFISADGGVLLATWWCYRDPVQTEAYAAGTLGALALAYLLGLGLKALYYCCFHPRMWRPPGRDPGVPPGVPPHDQPDSDVSFRSVSIQDDATSPQLVNRRMVCHAAHFYSTPQVLGRGSGASRAPAPRAGGVVV
ncbi:XK-related protein 8.3 [Cololabis saira]|uniref:XK-related protein 8.3 n=1 Tax=Cololabis saira TaxID=129043 RepID=UPI002AD30D80|nr:XK-related protein 8.3 [Cololabis saira]